MKRFFCLTILIIISACGPTFDVHKETSEELSSNSNHAEIGSRLQIVAFDVGEGDSTLIVSPEKTAALIDLGPEGSWNNKINPYLLANNIDLKYIFLSHGDNDHAGGLKESGLTAEATAPGNVYDLGEDIKLEIVAKDCEYEDGLKVECDLSDDNAHSEAILVTYKSWKYLTTGDLPGGGGDPPYQTIDMETHVGEIVGDIDLIHVGHHGSNTSTNQKFLDLVKPEMAIISVGDNNAYWHPHQTVVKRLLDAYVQVFQTEKGWLKNELVEEVNILSGDVQIFLGLP